MIFSILDNVVGEIIFVQNTEVRIETLAFCYSNGVEFLLGFYSRRGLEKHYFFACGILAKSQISRKAAKDAKRIKFGTQELMKKAFITDFLISGFSFFLRGLCAFA
jgi:hypothetical protein